MGDYDDQALAGTGEQDEVGVDVILAALKFLDRLRTVANSSTDMPSDTIRRQCADICCHAVHDNTKDCMLAFAPVGADVSSLQQ